MSTYGILLLLVLGLSCGKTSSESNFNFNITQLGSGFKDPGLCQDVKHAAPGKKEIIKIKNK